MCTAMHIYKKNWLISSQNEKFSEERSRGILYSYLIVNNTFHTLLIFLKLRWIKITVHFDTIQMKIKNDVCFLHVGWLGPQTNTLTHYTFLIQSKTFWSNNSQCYLLCKSSDFLKFPNTNILAEININLIL